MRTLALLASLAVMASALPATDSFNISTRPAREFRLFERAPALQSVAWRPDFESLAKAPILEDGRASADQMFGAGGALGVNSAAVGIGFSGWFDFYFTPWLAVGAWTSIDYGFVGRREHDGGSALMYNVNIGAKFVMDFPDMELTDWFRPWGAFYPLGFAYFAATEEADPAGSADRRDVSYSDLYYMMAAGVGIDFMLTNLIGVGFGLYLWGTIGGSTHEHDDNIETQTRGQFGIHFEYARLSLRF